MSYVRDFIENYKYFALFVSLIISVVYCCLLNSVGKYYTKTTPDFIRFNAIMTLICTVFFSLLSVGKSYSPFTVWFGIIFGIFTGLISLFKITALNIGPMHLTNLFTTSALIIPSLAGYIAYFGKAKPTVWKLIGISLLIVFLAISLLSKKDSKTKASVKWFIYSILCCLIAGVISLMQLVQQKQPDADFQLLQFLNVAFLSASAFSFICYFIVKRKSQTKEGFRVSKGYIAVSLFSAVCITMLNLFNLKLSGVMDPAILFPVLNGGSITIVSLASIFIFKEKITIRQIIGIVGGLASLMIIGLC